MLLIQAMPPVLDAEVTGGQGAVAAGLSPPALLAGLVREANVVHVARVLIRSGLLLRGSVSVAHD